MPKVRTGKTARDRANGALQRSADNKRARMDWDTDHRATNATFPRLSCNGKKNRSRVTAKGNKTVMV